MKYPKRKTKNFDVPFLKSNSSISNSKTIPSLKYIKFTNDRVPSLSDLSNGEASEETTRKINIDEFISNKNLVTLENIK